MVSDHSRQLVIRSNVFVALLAAHAFKHNKIFPVQQAKHKPRITLGAYPLGSPSFRERFEKLNKSDIGLQLV